MRLDPHLSQRLVKTVLWTLTGFTLLILIFIIADIAVKGLPQVTPAFLSQDSTDMGRAGGIFPTIVATAYITLLAILLAAPLGVGTAIYLTEYPREGWATRAIRFGSECLAGVPSIILGLFGFVLFVLKLGFGWSVLSGGLTLAIMVLPYVAAVSREVMLAVPAAQREAALALGATRWEAVWTVILPYGRAGIFGAVILGLGRALGETMAVTMLIGNRHEIGLSLVQPGYTIAAAIANEFAEAVTAAHLSALVLAGLVLFAITVAINAAARWLIWRVAKGSAAGSAAL